MNDELKAFLDREKEINLKIAEQKEQLAQDLMKSAHSLTLPLNLQNKLLQLIKNNMEETITAWIARDEDGGLHIYIGECPYKTDCEWNVIYRDLVYIQKLNNNSYPQVKWEDEEPTEVELTIKIKR